MSSNGEKRMMKKSGFAQKLLDDLRTRKEQLSIPQNTGEIEQTLLPYHYFPLLDLDVGEVNKS